MSYPIVYEVDFPEKRNRLTVFFRLLVAIPWFIVSIFYGIGAFFAIIIAWFALVFTAKYPQGLYDFNAGVLRFSTRLNGFFWLQVDELPPFDTGEHPEYPLRVQVAPPQDSYSRLHVFFRLITLIPVYIILYVLQIAYQIVGFIVWLVSVIIGSTPEGLQTTMRFCLTYQMKATAYGMLLTDAFPNFSEEGVSSAQPPPPPSGSAVSSSPPPPPPGS